MLLFKFSAVNKKNDPLCDNVAYIKKWTLSIVFLLMCHYIGAQNEIELRADGIVVPRTDTMNVVNPVKGMMIYDTLGDAYQYYNGSMWSPIGSGGAFVRSGTLVQQKAGIDTDDFVFGREELPPSTPISDNLFFFDQSKGAFRGGRVTDDSWAPDSIGTLSFAYGFNTKAIGSTSTALGDQTIASGFSGATALGLSTTASGSSGATALGNSTTASGSIGATALGNSTTASGIRGATALGYITDAIGDFGATALGRQTTASGFSGATALGRQTTASGSNGATALGFLTTASGDDGATALGSRTTASGDFGATALGFFTQATGDHCTVVGRYNDTLVIAGQDVMPTSPLFIVGNGDNNNLSNALVVRKDGLVSLQNFAFPIPDGSANQVMTTDGSGQLSWSDIDDNQNLSLLGNTLSITNDPTVVDLSGFLDNTDDWENDGSNIHFNTGKVGIGDNTPDAFLEIEKNSTSTSPHLLLTETNSSNFVRMRFENSGVAGFWTIATKKSATAADNVMFFNLDGDSNNDFLELRGDGNHKMDGTLTQTSDSRLKHNIRKIENKSGDLMKINGYTYNWKNPNRNQAKQIGLIAQEVQEYFPELVEENEKGILSVNYIGLVPVLLESIKEQEKKINQLSNEQNDQKTIIANLQIEMNELKSLVTNMMTTKKELKGTD